MQSSDAIPNESRSATGLCASCKSGYHAPFERFERVAVIPDGPLFLKRCMACGTLWQESLRDARPLTKAEAIAQFPAFAISGEDGA